MEVSNYFPMIPRNEDIQSFPIPRTLREDHPSPDTPWNFPPEIFQKIQNQPWDSTNQYKLCELTSSDSLYPVVYKYFYHQPPPNLHIKKVHCIHNPSQTQQFVGMLKNMEQEANKFPPQWQDEENKDQRKLVIQRWKILADQFSPIKIPSSQRTDTIHQAKVFLLWHGSSKEKCTSICNSGFTYFGKHHHFDKEAKPGLLSSTDIGYFGSGIYFTDSAKYAAMYCRDHILLAFVSMCEPYPVINEVPHPQKGKDMKKLEGKGAYQTYNAHFIPVASINPSSPHCMEYHPCIIGEKPAWDEFVVFQKSQTLPRFWVELGIDLPKPIQPKESVKKIDPGLNLEGICKNGSCKTFEKKVTHLLGFGKEFNIAKEAFLHFVCPYCQKKEIELDSIILSNCNYFIDGRDENATEVKLKGIAKKANDFYLNVQNWKYAYVTTTK